MCDVGCWQVNLFFLLLSLPSVFFQTILFLHVIQKKLPSSASQPYLTAVLESDKRDGLQTLSLFIWLPDSVEKRLPSLTYFQGLITFLVLVCLFFIFSLFLIGSSQEIPEALGQFTANHLMTLQTRFFLFSFSFLSHSLFMPCLLSCPPPLLTLIFCPLPCGSFISSPPRAFSCCSNLGAHPTLIQKKETHDLTTNVLGICKGVFFFFYPHRDCFYLSKREHALLSSESVFVKFHVVFPWLSGEGFGAKIIHAIEQAEKKILKRANVFVHSSSLQKEKCSLHQPHF